MISRTKLSERNGAANSVAGHIRERVYLGEMAQYQFTAGPHEIRVYELNPRFVETSGQRELFASVDPQDVVVLPR